MTGKNLLAHIEYGFLNAATENEARHYYRRLSSLCRDWASERTSIPRDVCEVALAHSLKDKTEAAYKRTDLFDKRRKLMDLWSRFATEEHGEVIALRTSRK